MCSYGMGWGVFFPAGIKGGFHNGATAGICCCVGKEEGVDLSDFCSILWVLAFMLLFWFFLGFLFDRLRGWRGWVGWELFVEVRYV